MAEAASFVRQIWTALKPKVAAPALEAKVAGAISPMEQAAGRKDSSAAAKAAQTELDLVDDLEKLFASRQHPRAEPVVNRCPPSISPLGSS